MRRAIFNVRTFGPFCSSCGVMPRSVACASKQSRDHGLCSMKRWQWSKCPGTYINFGPPENLQELEFFWQKKREKSQDLKTCLYFFEWTLGGIMSLCLNFANLVIVVHVFQTFEFLLPTFVYAGEDLSVRNQNLEGLLDDVLAKNQLSRTAELPQWSDLLQLSRKHVWKMTAFHQLVKFCNMFFSKKGFPPLWWNSPRIFLLLELVFFSKNVSSQFNPKLFFVLRTTISLPA